MRRDVLLLEEMIEAAVQAMDLVEGVSVEDLAAASPYAVGVAKLAGHMQRGRHDRDGPSAERLPL